MSSNECICITCLFWWSQRCPYGKCRDDYRAKINPYDKAHPDRPPRMQWSKWNRPGEQAHWCRGGSFYPEQKCEKYIEYTGSRIEDCLAAPIQIFQDGYTSCTLKEQIGCDACIAREEGKQINEFDCDHMTDTGCARMFTAKSLILLAIQEGENIEPCREQCCIGCKRASNCGFRCGYKSWTVISKGEMQNGKI